MFKVRFYTVFCELLDFIKLNAIKFIAAGVIFALAVVLSVRNALTITDVSGYLISHNNATVLLISGEKSAVSYFFARLFMCAILAGLMLLFSSHVAAAWLNYILLFLYAYILCLYMTLYVVLFKFAVLPLILLCLLPCLLASFFLLAFLSVCSFCRGCEIKRFGNNQRVCFKGFVVTITPILILLGVLCLLEAVLAYFCTLGLLL